MKTRSNDRDSSLRRGAAQLAMAPTARKRALVGVVAGSAAGFTESVVTTPLEVMKTRMQLTNTRSFSAFWRSPHFPRGLRDAYAGFAPTVMQTLVKVGLRFGVFDALKPLMNNNDLLAGMTAGALEALIWIAPTDRLRVLRMEPRTRYGSATAAATQLSRHDGWTSLWRGAGPTIVRNSASVGVRLWMFERMMAWSDRALGVRRKQDRASWTSALAGFLAGLSTTVLNQPIDVVKTIRQSSNSDKVMSDILVANGGPGEAKKSTSSMDILARLYREKGWRGFTPGLGPRLVKISVGQAVIMSVYSKVQTAMLSSD